MIEPITAECWVKFEIRYAKAMLDLCRKEGKRGKLPGEVPKSARSRADEIKQAVITALDKPRTNGEIKEIINNILDFPVGEVVLRGQLWRMADGDGLIRRAGKRVNANLWARVRSNEGAA